jgi:hypothetical protein
MIPILVVLLLFVILSVSNTKTINKIEPCKLHKWEYQGGGKDLVCQQCSKTPGQIMEQE